MYIIIHNVYIIIHNVYIQFVNNHLFTNHFGVRGNFFIFLVWFNTQSKTLRKQSCVYLVFLSLTDQINPTNPISLFLNNR